MEAYLNKQKTHSFIATISTLLLLIAALILAYFLLTKPASLTEVAQGHSL
jgi:hypothetical protein